MGDLHLETSMNEIEPLRKRQIRFSIPEQRTNLGTRDVHRRSELSMNETLVDAHIFVVLSRMRENNLSKSH